MICIKIRGVPSSRVAEAIHILRQWQDSDTHDGHQANPSGDVTPPIPGERISTGKEPVSTGSLIGLPGDDAAHWLSATVSPAPNLTSWAATSGTDDRASVITFLPVLANHPPDRLIHLTGAADKESIITFVPLLANLGPRYPGQLGPTIGGGPIPLGKLPTWYNAARGSSTGGVKDSLTSMDTLTSTTIPRFHNLVPKPQRRMQ